MKKIMVKLLLILIVCSIFLLNQELIMKCAKKMTTDIPTGPYVNVIHEYYTNNLFDGSVIEYQSVIAPTYSVPKTIYSSEIEKKKSYKDKQYVYTSITSNPTTVTVSKGAMGSQGTFRLRYDRTLVTLKYDANGGANPPEVETVEWGTIVTIKNDNDSKMTNVNHEFLGWSINPEATIADWKPNDKMPMNSNVTLYAVWNKIVDNGRGISVDKTRIAINRDSKKLTAEAGDEIIWNITITNNSNVSKNITINEELRGAGLSIDLFTLPAGETKTVTARYTVKNNDRGMLYNRIRVNDGVEDKVYTDQGTKVGNDVTAIWRDGFTDTPIKTEPVPQDIDYALLYELYPADPTREDYTFKGWSNPKMDVDGNITITATWKSDSEPTYTVIYKDEFNSFSSQETYALQEGTATPKFKEEPGKTQILEDGAIVPIRDGYRFIGWSKRINKVVSAEDANENYEIVYVANWQKMDTSPNEDITPPQIINKDNSNKVDNPLTEDKILKYITSGIISLLLIIIIILKNKKSIKGIFSNNKNSFF